MSDGTWVLAMRMTDKPLICDGCGGEAEALYRPYGEPRLHGLLCTACAMLPGTVLTDDAEAGKERP